MDFGYIVNTGVTIKQEIYNDTFHDQVGLRMELQLSDDVTTADGETHDFHIAIQIGDLIVVSKFQRVRGSQPMVAMSHAAEKRLSAAQQTFDTI